MRSTLQRLVAVFFAAALAVGLTLPFGNHHAMAAIGDCPSGQFCWWTNANYLGPWGHRTWSDIWDNPGSCWSMGPAGNSMSSYYNKATNSVFLATNTGDCHDPMGSWIYSGESNSNMALYGDIPNDQVGGIQWIG